MCYSEEKRKSFKWLKQIIGQDLSRTERPAGYKEILKGYAKYSTYRLTVWFRICQYLKYKNRKLLYVLCYVIFNHYKKSLGIDLAVSTPVGAGLSIVHGGAMFLNAERIGRNFCCFQAVTIGTARVGKTERPIIEDHVTVYTGAVIAGGIVLHSGCVVAANCVVTHDVPPNSLVAGVPGRVVKQW